MNNIKISFIIPTYNSANFLKKCLDSILEQNYDNYEIIIVNDGSTDNTYDILLEYKKNKKIFIINNKNNGVSFSRNIGLKQASGDYICFIDSDDFLTNNTLLSVVNYINDNNKPDIIKFPYNFVNKKNTTKYKFTIMTNRLINNTEYDKLIYPYIFKTYDLSGVIPGFYKKNIIDGIMFDEKLKYAEDMFFMIQALKNSSNILFGDIYYYNYFLNTNSATNIIDIDKNIKQINDNYYVFKSINELLNLNDDLEINERMRKLINYKLVLFANKNYKIYKKNVEKLYKNMCLETIQKKSKIITKKAFYILKMKYIKHAIKLKIVR